jgi:DNA-binding GntR family transcriptional regulator
MSVPARTSRRTADAVFTHLQGAIVRGELTPGERVDLDAVGQQLDVSRTPIREALLRLEAEGLVERVPYRGAIVRGVDAALAEETTAVRLHLEGMAVRLAVARLTDETLEEMERLLRELAALERSASYDATEWNRLNDRFHGALYAAADCPSLTRPIEALAAQANRIRTHFDVRGGPVDEEHRAILDACRARDADAAAHAAQDHILHAHQRMFPDAQIAPDSALGVAISLAARKIRRRRRSSLADGEETQNTNDRAPSTAPSAP